MIARLLVRFVNRTAHSGVRRVGTFAALALVLSGAAQAGETGAGPGGPARGNAVTHWNAVATTAFTPSQGTNPMAQSRTLAILHAAIHDAVNAIDPQFEPYTPGLTKAPGASVDAAVAAAAHDVLVRLLPEQAAMVQGAYDQALARIADGTAKNAGILTGQAAAAANIARRQGDGSDIAAQPVYEPRPHPGEYQFTPPFDLAAQPSWGRVTPFIIDLEEHALEGPHRLSSAAYALDYTYIKSIGERVSSTRTPEQSEIAEFWYEDSPPGWNRIANTAVRERRLDPSASARALALVNFAMADGFIAGFEAKYRFRFWRPETAIRAGATDGNPRTRAGRDVGALPGHAASAGLSLDAHSSRVGGSAGADRAARGQGALDGRQPHTAWNHPGLQAIVGGRRREWSLSTLRRDPLRVCGEGGA